jgi:two-component system chemotaxis response regulator CheB
MRVVLVEDSPTQARAIAHMLEADGDISVVATAGDATAAVEQVARLRPDVAIMDLDIPAGGGRVAIDRIMSATPTPILVLSGMFDHAAAPEAVDALAAGAVEAVPKPKDWTTTEAATLRRMVRRVQGVPVIGRRGRAPARTAEPVRAAAPFDGGTQRVVPPTSAVIGVAASTGGPAAVAAVLAGLRSVKAPVLVVQHIHASFAESFARWLAGAAGMPVSVAVDGARLEPGKVIVAPGGVHLRLGPRRTAVLTDQPEGLHRPSADVLFQSMAITAGADAVGVVLTGMGADGAEGLAALRRAGGHAFAQDEASSVVFGMPQAALRTGAVDGFTSLSGLSGAIRRALGEPER